MLNAKILELQTMLWAEQRKRIELQAERNHDLTEIARLESELQTAVRRYDTLCEKVASAAGGGAPGAANGGGGGVSVASGSPGSAATASATGSPGSAVSGYPGSVGARAALRKQEFHRGEGETSASVHTGSRRPSPMYLCHAGGVSHLAHQGADVPVPAGS